MKSSTAVEQSSNKKIDDASATYSSMNSCPSSCSWFNNGCYGQVGYTGIIFRRLTKSNVTSSIGIAKEEAFEIDKLSGKRDLRLHVVGDAKTNGAVEILAQASKRFIARSNNRNRIYPVKVWTYTHNHITPRKAWGIISVLRSCETVEQAKKSINEGFGSALVVEKFEKETAYDIGSGLKGIPCPEQTGRATSCTDCRLCLNADKLQKNNLVILFSAHGTQKNKVIKQLNVLNER